MKMILIPCTQWRAGKPNVSIRKAAVVCQIKLVEQQLIDPEKMYGCYKSMMSYLKNCLDDDWANDLRYASVVLMRHVLEYI